MITRNRFKTALTLAAVAMALLGSVAQAGLLVYEPFAYADGWLTGLGGALGTTGTWTTNDSITATGWRVHQEGDISGVNVDIGVRNMFDGTVANLPTLGGYAGLPGPLDVGRGEDEDFEIGRYMNASIALDPTVTATFQSGATTWFSFVTAHGWDRNQQAPHFIIGTDTTPDENRGIVLSNNGSGIGGGGGAPRNNREDIFPQYFDAGLMNNALGTNDGVNFNSIPELSDATHNMPWEEFTPGGDFGPPNIVVGKIQWDADTGGEDIISVVRFLEADELTEAEFDALIALKPALSSANWDSERKPDLDQSLFDTIDLYGTKIFIDEIRIGTTFEDVIGAASDPNLPEVDAGISMITWSAKAVLMVPTITPAPGSDWMNLTYLWTAEPDGIGDPNLDVAIADADTENASVTITKTAPTGDATVVELTLAVNNEGRLAPPVTDTMTIDVYDNACLATAAAGLLVLDPTDFNEDCVTNFQDLVELTEAWLEDYTLTAPAPK